MTSPTLPMDWDTPANVTHGVTDQSILVYNPDGSIIPVGVPRAMTAREFAAIIHGFDGHTVKGFGYEPDQEHPADCALCASGEPEFHNYEATENE